MANDPGAGQGGGPSASSGGTKKYILSDKSDVTSLYVKPSKKTLEVNGDAVELTEDEYKSVKDLPGVKLTEAK